MTPPVGQLTATRDVGQRAPKRLAELIQQARDDEATGHFGVKVFFQAGVPKTLYLVVEATEK